MTRTSSASTNNHTAVRSRPGTFDETITNGDEYSGGVRSIHAVEGRLGRPPNREAQIGVDPRGRRAAPHRPSGAVDASLLRGAAPPRCDPPAARTRERGSRRTRAGDPGVGAAA